MVVFYFVSIFIKFIGIHSCFYKNNFIRTSFLMITPYSKNINLSSLFVYYTLDSQVSLSSYMSIKTGLFSFCLSIVSLFRFLVIQNITVLWKIFKKLGENKNKLRTIYPKNHENFKNSKPRVQFYWFL